MGYGKAVSLVFVFFFFSKKHYFNTCLDFKISRYLVYLCIVAEKAQEDIFFCVGYILYLTNIKLKYILPVFGVSLYHDL